MDIVTDGSNFMSAAEVIWLRCEFDCVDYPYELADEYVCDNWTWINACVSYRPVLFSAETTTLCFASDGTTAINYLPTRWCPSTLEFSSTGICRPNLPRISDWMEWANSRTFIFNWHYPAELLPWRLHGVLSV